MGRIRELSDALWNGDKTTEVGQGSHPLSLMLGLEEYAAGLGFIASFGNVTAIDTDDGAVLVDTGSFLTGMQIRSTVADWAKHTVKAAVYTHGHVDHVGGIAAIAAGQETPIEVLSHEAVAARFDRYIETAGYNGHINRRQFRIPGLKWPTDYRYPDTTFRDRHVLEVGSERFELIHDRGETDDHTWVWIPGRRALCTGDLFIWAAPNCGNPQKSQRYPKEWAAALRKMAALGPEVMFPGHGPPIEGADRVQQALTESAELLESLYAQTLERMNAGLQLDAILHEVRAPAHLLERPYLRPVYDEPEFVVRNLWRLYGGWYDGNPARLKPPKDAAVAGEVASLAGGVEALVARAQALSEAGEHRMACQLAEWAAAADPASDPAKTARADIYRRRVKSETSLMARSIFTAAADD